MSKRFVVFRKGLLEKQRSSFNDSNESVPERRRPSVSKVRETFSTAIGKLWVSRYFVWHSRGITYWKSERYYIADKRPLGFLAYEDGLSVSARDGDEQGEREAKDRYFEFRTCSQTILVKARSRKERQEWISVFGKMISHHESRETSRQSSSTRGLSKSSCSSLDGPNHRTGLVDFASDYSFVEPWDDDRNEAGHIDSLIAALPHAPASFVNPVLVEHGMGDDACFGPDKASVDDLVELLFLSVAAQGSHESSSDGSQAAHTFIRLFFLVHSNLLSSKELFARLVKGFSEAVGDEAKQTHALDLISSWLQLFPNDMRELEREFLDFVRVVALPVVPPHQWAVKVYIEELEKVYRETIALNDSKVPARGATATFLRKFVHEVKDVCSFSASDIAQELTGMDCHIFKLIQPRELLRKEWKRDTAAERAPNVLKMIELFNQRSYWVASAILTRRSISERTVAIKTFIELLQELEGMNNFYGAYAVLNGLTMTPVFRLKSAWNPVSNRLKSAFQLTKQRFDSAQGNYKSYRKLYDDIPAEVPKIPHLAVLLQDLYGCEEIKNFEAAHEPGKPNPREQVRFSISLGERSGIVGPELSGRDSIVGPTPVCRVNWHKFKKLYRPIRAVLEAQQVIQWMQVVPSCPNLRLSIGAGAQLDEDELWKLSYLFDPRGSRTR